MRRFVLVALGLVLCLPALSNVALPGVFGDGMVLQQGMPLPVWGTADPGEQVTVAFRDQTRMATAGPDGQWRVTLSPLVAPERQSGYVLAVTGKNTVTFRDVLIGEVWFGSGQSNMSWRYETNATKEEVARAEYPEIRLNSDVLWPSNKTEAPNHADPNLHGDWVRCTPETAGKFSALLLNFGIALHRELRVPVGLIARAVGGSSAGPWIPGVAFLTDARCQAEYTHYREIALPALQAAYPAKLAAWEQAAAEAKAKGQAAPRQPKPPADSPWLGVPNMGEYFQRFVQPIVPYAFRGMLWDQGEGGTGVPEVRMQTLMAAGLRYWRQAWGNDFPFLFVGKPSGGGYHWEPTGTAAPLPALPKSVADCKVSAAVGRESHQSMLILPRTEIVTSIDLGEGIHPTDKDRYGQRACRVALGVVYGRHIEYAGPRYAGYIVAGNTIRLRFTHLGAGLIAPPTGTLQGFAIAGADRRFVWADARIEGETVVVSSDVVPAPVAVRYAWDAQPRWANLFNKDGFAALPFRTDDWAE